MKVANNLIVKLMILTIMTNLMITIKVSNNKKVGAERIQNKLKRDDTKIAPPTGVVLPSAPIQSNSSTSVPQVNLTGATPVTGSTVNTGGNIGTGSVVSTTVVNSEVRASTFDPVLSPTVIGDLFQKIKKLNVNDSDLYNTCVKMSLESKNEENMRTLWNNIRLSQVANPPSFIKRDFFREFILSFEDSVKVDGMPRKCDSILKKNIIDQSEFESKKKQDELKDNVSPFFPSTKTLQLGKNIITAFIGVHRDSDIAANLIPKLNGH